MMRVEKVICRQERRKSVRKARGNKEVCRREEEAQGWGGEREWW